VPARSVAQDTAPITAPAVRDTTKPTEDTAAVEPEPKRYEDPMTHDDFVDATKRVKRLPPSAFPDLPAPAREWLEKEGYSIPQSYYTRQPHNVIYGEFYTPDTLDLAVLASRNLESRVIVFRRGVEPDTMCDSPTEDVGYMKGNGDYIEFSRLIVPAESGYLTAKYKIDKTMLPLKHQGIKVVELDGFSTYTLYHAKNEWYGLELIDAGD